MTDASRSQEPQEPEHRARSGVDPTHPGASGHVDASHIEPRPIEPEKRPVIRGVLLVVGVTVVLAALFRLLAG